MKMLLETLSLDLGASPGMSEILMVGTELDLMVVFTSACTSASCPFSWRMTLLKLEKPFLQAEGDMDKHAIISFMS